MIMVLFREGEKSEKFKHWSTLKSNHNNAVLGTHQLQEEFLFLNDTTVTEYDRDYFHYSRLLRKINLNFEISFTCIYENYISIIGSIVYLKIHFSLELKRYIF